MPRVKMTPNFEKQQSHFRFNVYEPKSCNDAQEKIDRYRSRSVIDVIEPWANRFRNRFRDRFAFNGSAGIPRSSIFALQRGSIGICYSI